MYFITFFNASVSRFFNRRGRPSLVYFPEITAVVQPNTLKNATKENIKYKNKTLITLKLYIGN
jgi:hypothetical protein